MMILVSNLLLFLHFTLIFSMKLHMMWTTPALTMQNIHLQILHGYFFHHPDLQLKLYVTDYSSPLWSSLLEEFIGSGYSIEMIHINPSFLEHLVSDDQCSSAKAWVSNRHKYHSGKYYYSHLTDFLRFCLLIRHGGIYSDFDALLIRPFPQWMFKSQLVAGKDRVGEECGWCLDGGNHYLAPGVMIAQKGSLLLREALKIGFNMETYDPEIFNAVGPKALTMASRKVPKSSYQAINGDLFYPVNYLEANQLFSKIPKIPRIHHSNDTLIYKELIDRRSVNIHLFGAKTRNIKIEDGSIIDLYLKQQQRNITFPDYYVTNNDIIKLEGLRVNAGYKVIEVSVDNGFLIYHGEEANQVQCRGTIKELNICLSKIEFNPSDEAISIMTVASFEIPIYNLPKVLTITIKTMDRMSKVTELITSVRNYYPSVPIVVTNDGLEAYSIDGGIKRGGFLYIPLPYDTGLSRSRNIMVSRIDTPLVMIIDDDFIFTRDSKLEYLVHSIIRGGVDIAAAKSPADFDQHNIDYSGKFKIRDGILEIISESYGRIPNTSCDIVDVVPNIFIAKRESLVKVPWDENLKLGEHEDFFLRAKQMGLIVASCNSVTLSHRQDPHWLNKTLYDKMRNRVWEFLKLSLKKHNLIKLEAFGMSTMVIQDIKVEDIQKLTVTDLQPFSVAIDWKSYQPYHCYMIDAFDITDCEDDEQPGELTITKSVYPSRSNPITPKYVVVDSLEPDRYYRIVVRPGNHTNVSPHGPEVIIRTPSYEMGNLLLNGNFNFETNEYWEAYLTNHAKLVLLQYPSEGVNRKPGHSWSRNGQFTKDQGVNFAMSLAITNGEYNDPAEALLSQSIPSGEFPQYCRVGACQISASGWCDISKIIGYGRSIKVALQIVLRWKDNRREIAYDEFDYSREGKWQMVAFSRGIHQSNELEGVEIRLLVRAHRALIFCDDFYLSMRKPI